MNSKIQDVDQRQIINLDDQSLVQKYDTEDMYNKIIHLPEQIMNSYNNPKVNSPPDSNMKNSLKTKPIRRVIIAGMGGSAISGDILEAAFSSYIPIQVFKDYHIPNLMEDDLFIACSYSGNTEETVSCLKQALKKTKYIAGITSGGIVKSLINGKHIWCELPGGFPPRSAIGYLFFSLVIIMEQFELIPKQKKVVEATISSLMLKAGALSLNVNTDLNLAKQAALAIQGKIPLIYAANPSLNPIAYRWKCQLNENSKYPAFCHTFSEMNHNEIEAWENDHFNKMFIPVFVAQLDEDYSYKKRINFFKNYMNAEGVDYLDYYGEGNSFLERIFSLIYLGDMTSYYLALLQKINPTTINLIMNLKKEIS